MHFFHLSRRANWRLVIASTWAAAAFGQTTIDLAHQSRNVDFSGAPFTRPSKTGTVLPATCNVGETFFLTSATAGNNWYGCAAANTWSLQGSGAPYSGATRNVDLGTHSLHAGSISTGDGAVSPVVILPELSAHGANDTRIYGADSQASSGCIIWPVGMSTTGQIAADSGTTETTTDGNSCRIFTWQTPPVSSFNTRTGEITLSASDVNGVGSITNNTTGNAASVGGVTVTGTPTAGQVPTATSSSTATWQTPAASSGNGTPCITSASPAVCGSHTTGYVAIPAGAGATLVVDTTAVTANSIIVLAPDVTLGSALGVTCLVTPFSNGYAPFVANRTTGAGFTIQIGGVSSGNPTCVAYAIF